MGSLSLQKKKRNLLIIGVTSISDPYPNVKYKINTIQSLGRHDDNVSLCISDMGTKDSFWSISGSAGLLKKIIFAFKLFFSSVFVSIKTIISRPDRIYILYPSLILSTIISIVPKSIRPEVTLDGFISLYDTIILDRQLFSKNSIIARALFRIEQHSFRSSDLVLVDTLQNANFYSELFDVSPSKFYSLPLSIPQISRAKQLSCKDGETLNVVFFGTFVPLHGVSTIIDAARTLNDEEWVKFHIIGDGQEAPLLEQAISDGLSNINWQRSMLSATNLCKLIEECHVTLGIFSAGDKAQRVIPYKHYYYMCLGRPIISADTAAMRHLTTLNPLAHDVIKLVEPDSSDSLVTALREMYEQKSDLARLQSTASDFFNSNLSSKKIEQELRHVFKF